MLNSYYLGEIQVSLGILWLYVCHMTIIPSSMGIQGKRRLHLKEGR